MRLLLFIILIKDKLKYIRKKKSPEAWDPGDFRKYLYSVI